MPSHVCGGRYSWAFRLEKPVRHKTLSKEEDIEVTLRAHSRFERAHGQRQNSIITNFQ